MPTERSQIQFEEDKDSNGQKKRLLYSRIVPSSVPPAIVRFLIEHRIVKNARQADVLLLVIFILCIIASVSIFVRPTPTPSDITKEAVTNAILNGHRK